MTTTALRWDAVPRRAIWYAFVVACAITCIAITPWGLATAGIDFSRYVSGDYAAGYLYSPAFAALISPLRLLPFPVALAVWRALDLVLLWVAVRGTHPAAYLVFAMPWLWASDVLFGNVAGIATAAMIAVVRWPSVRTVSLYALLVALVPKPAFLPVLLYGVVTVPAARRWVALCGAFGVAMLLWPGYLAAIMQNEGLGAMRLPILLWIPLSVASTLVAIRRPRLLGAASVVASPYLLPYSFVPLAVGLVQPGSRPLRTT